MSLSKNDIKFIRSLHQKKNRDQEGLFIVEGVKMVNELLKQDKFKVQEIYCLENAELDLINGASINIVSPKDIERISTLKKPNQVLATVQQISFNTVDFKSNSPVVVLDRINDPGNLGTIIRTADWFGVKQIICSQNSVDIYNPKVVQSTMGAIFRMEVFYQPALPVLEQFKSEGFEVLSAEMNGTSIYDKSFNSKSVFVMGSESHGVEQELSEACEKITIPTFGNTESLNVAMATGIILSHYSKSCS